MLLGSFLLVSTNIFAIFLFNRKNFWHNLWYVHIICQVLQFQQLYELLTKHWIRLQIFHYFLTFLTPKNINSTFSMFVALLLHFFEKTTSVIQRKATDRLIFLQIQKAQLSKDTAYNFGIIEFIKQYNLFEHELLQLPLGYSSKSNVFSKNL